MSAAVEGHLGLGANLGDRRASLVAAIAALRARGVQPLACSSLYETAPVGDVADQPPFLNACLHVRTELPPERLLDACKEVERELGRAPGLRHGPRAIDVDVLLLGALEHRSARLTVPHAELAQRRFVLIPLLELAPALRLPDGTVLADALARLDAAAQPVARAGDPPIALVAAAPAGG